MAQIKNTELFPRLKTVLENYGKKLAETYRKELIEGDHVASKNLFNSVKTYVEVKGNSYVVEFMMADYGEYLEQGTKPHFPPVSAIENWIRVKKIVPRRDSQGKLPTQRQLAYLIARKISEEGTKATHLFDIANNLTLADFEKKIADALDKDVEENLEEIIESKRRTKIRR